MAEHKRRAPKPVRDPNKLTEPSSLLTLGNGLELKESRIPGAGKGVWGTKSHDFKRGDLITEYFGRVLNKKAYEEVAKLGSEFNAYVLHVGNNESSDTEWVAIDGRVPTYIKTPGLPCGQWANDPLNPELYNCCFSWYDEATVPNYVPLHVRPGTLNKDMNKERPLRIFLVATIDFNIKGQELYVPYGPAYWHEFMEKNPTFVPRVLLPPQDKRDPKWSSRPADPDKDFPMEDDDDDDEETRDRPNAQGKGKGKGKGKRKREDSPSKEKDDEKEKDKSSSSSDEKEKDKSSSSIAVQRDAPSAASPNEDSPSVNTPEADRSTVPVATSTPRKLTRQQAAAAAQNVFTPAERKCIVDYFGYAGLEQQPIDWPELAKRMVQPVPFNSRKQALLEKTREPQVFFSKPLPKVKTLQDLLTKGWKPFFPPKGEPVPTFEEAIHREKVTGFASHDKEIRLASFFEPYDEKSMVKPQRRSVVSVLDVPWKASPVGRFFHHSFNQHNALLECRLSKARKEADLTLVLSNLDARSKSHEHPLPFWNFAAFGTKFYIVYDVLEAEKLFAGKDKTKDYVSRADLSKMEAKCPPLPIELFLQMPPTKACFLRFSSLPRADGKIANLMMMPSRYAHEVFTTDTGPATAYGGAVAFFVPHSEASAVTLERVRQATRERDARLGQHVEHEMSLDQIYTDQEWQVLLQAAEPKSADHYQTVSWPVAHTHLWLVKQSSRTTEHEATLVNPPSRTTDVKRHGTKRMEVDLTGPSSPSKPAGTAGITGITGPTGPTGTVVSSQPRRRVKHVVLISGAPGSGKTTLMEKMTLQYADNANIGFFELDNFTQWGGGFGFRHWQARRSKRQAAFLDDDKVFVGRAPTETEAAELQKLTNANWKKLDDQDRDLIKSYLARITRPRRSALERKAIQQLNSGQQDWSPLAPVLRPYLEQIRRLKPTEQEFAELKAQDDADWAEFAKVQRSLIRNYLQKTERSIVVFEGVAVFYRKARPDGELSFRLDLDLFDPSARSEVFPYPDIQLHKLNLIVDRKTLIERNKKRDREVYGKPDFNEDRVTEIDQSIALRQHNTANHHYQNMSDEQIASFVDELVKSYPVVQQPLVVPAALPAAPVDEAKLWKRDVDEYRRIRDLLVDKDKLFTKSFRHAILGQTRQGKKTKVLQQPRGTLQNGGVYVAWCDHGLGLFAGRAFKKGTYVSDYGGGWRHRKELTQTSWARIIPDTSQTLVRDGRMWAEQLRRAASHLNQQNERKKPPGERTKILPETLAVAGLAPNDVQDLILNSGVGYMCNHGDRQTNNVLWKDVPRLNEAEDLGPIMFMVATRDIAKDEEILFNYQNEESRRGSFDVSGGSSSTSLSLSGSGSGLVADTVATAAAARARIMIVATAMEQLVTRQWLSLSSYTLSTTTSSTAQADRLKLWFRQWYTMYYTWQAGLQINTQQLDEALALLLTHVQLSRSVAVARASHELDAILAAHVSALRDAHWTRTVAFVQYHRPSSMAQLKSWLTQPSDDFRWWWNVATRLLHWTEPLSDSLWTGLVQATSSSSSSTSFSEAIVVRLARTHLIRQGHLDTMVLDSSVLRNLLASLASDSDVKDEKTWAQGVALPTLWDRLLQQLQTYRDELDPSVSIGLVRRFLLLTLDSGVVGEAHLDDDRVVWHVVSTAPAEAGQTDPNLARLQRACGGLGSVRARLVDLLAYGRRQRPMGWLRLPSATDPVQTWQEAVEMKQDSRPKRLKSTMLRQKPLAGSLPICQTLELLRHAAFRPKIPLTLLDVWNDVFAPVFI